MILFLCWTILIVLTGRNLLQKFLPERTGPDRLIDLFTLAYGEIVFTGTVLGLAGIISPLSFTILISLLFLLSRILSPGQTWPAFPTKTALPDRDAIFLFLVTLLVYLFNIYAQSVLPVLTTDGLIYHLPKPLMWWQNNSLSPVFLQDVYLTYYPIGSELIYLFHLLALGNSPFLNFVQIPFAVYSALIVYRLAEKTGLDSKTAFLSAVLLLLLKPVFMQTYLVYVDLMMVTFFLASVYYLLPIKDTRKLPLLMLSVGLLLNSKTLALIFVIPLLPQLVRAFSAPANGSGQERTPAFLLKAAGLFGLLAIGLYPYLSNLYLTGNPVFPMTVSWHKMEILKGIFRSEPFPLISRLKGSLFFFLQKNSMADIGTVFSLFLSAGWLLGLVYAFRRRRGRFLLLMPLLCMGLFILLVPPKFFNQPRLLIVVYPFLIIGMLLALSAVGVFREKSPWEKPALFCLLFAFFSQYAWPDKLIYCAGSAGLYLAVYLLYPAVREKGAHFRNKIIGYAILFLALFSVYLNLRAARIAGPARFVVWELYYKNEVVIWEWIHQNSEPEPKVIACLGVSFLYPLYGDQLRNRVYYQPVNSPGERLVHTYDYHPQGRYLSTMDNPEIVYRQNPDFRIWLEGLRLNRTNWLLIAPPAGEKPWVEEEWINSHPEYFQLLFENPAGRIYAFTG